MRSFAGLLSSNPGVWAHASFRSKANVRATAHQMLATLERKSDALDRIRICDQSGERFVGV
jgi:hypothetical protein